MDAVPDVKTVYAMSIDVYAIQVLQGRFVKPEVDDNRRYSISFRLRSNELSIISRLLFT